MSSSPIVQKRKRGRPANEKTDPTPSTRQQAIDSDSGDDSSDDDQVFIGFHPGARPAANSLATLPRPKFEEGEHYMWFQTTQVGHIAKIFKCLTKLLSRQANVVFAPGGWRIVSVNHSHTAIIYLRITEQTMDEGLYDCNYSFRISLPIDAIASRMRGLRRSEVMAFTLTGKKPDTIRLDFSAGHRRTDVELRLREPDEEHLEVPTQVYHTQVDLPAEEFREVINSLKSDNLITDITFTKHPNKFTITVSTITGKINTHFFPDNSHDSVRFTNSGGNTNAADAEDGADGPVLTATFPIGEIIAFTEVTPAAKWVSINMPEPDGPHVLKVSYSLAALGEMAFYLSQKLNVDDENADLAAIGE